MKNEELLQAIHALAKERGIDEEVLFEAIEEAIVAERAGFCRDRS